jgi:LysM repeat protein
MLIVTILLALAGFAQASEYTVAKNDTLSAIAEKHGFKHWRSIHRANPQIANPDLIFPGQKLVIPTSQPAANQPAKPRQAYRPKAASGSLEQSVLGVPFSWTRSGGDKFGNRDHVKALELLPGADTELKQSLIKVYTEQSGEPAMIVPGTRFDWLLFGNYKWRFPAIWKGKEDLPALVWPEVEYKGRLYKLTLSTICNNLGVSSRPTPPPPTTVEPPKEAPPVVEPPKEETPAPPPTVEPPKEETPAPPPTVEPPKEETPAPPPEGSCCKWAPDYKGALFIAPRWGVKHPNTDREFIYGGEMDVFPGYCGNDSQKHYPGVSIKGVGWDGQFREKNGGLLNFEGNQIVYGGVYEYRQPDDLSMLHLRYGKQVGEVSNTTGYAATEENKLLNVEARHLHKTNHDWPSEVQVGARADIDLGGKKQSSVFGRPLTPSEDPRRDQTNYGGTVQASLYSSTTVEPLVGTTVDYTTGARVLGVEPYVGAKVLEEQMEPSVHYRSNNGPDNPSDTFGFNLIWNFDRTLNKAGAYAKKWWANRGVQEAQAVTPTETVETSGQK